MANLKIEIKLSGKEGAAAAKRIFAALLLFWLPNLVFVVWGTVRLLGSGFVWTNLLLFLISLAVGVGFSVVSFLTAYRYVLILTAKTAQPYIKPILKKICDRVAQEYIDDPNFGEKIKKAFDFKTLLAGIHDGEMPWLAKKALVFLFEPFINFIRNLSVDTKSNNAETISASIYSQTNDYMVNELFKNNNMRLFLYLFPANMTVQLLCIAFIR